MNQDERFWSKVLVRGDSSRELARRYGVSRRTIQHAVNRKTWAHVA